MDDEFREENERRHFERVSDDECRSGELIRRRHTEEYAGHRRMDIHGLTKPCHEVDHVGAHARNEGDEYRRETPPLRRDHIADPPEESEPVHEPDNEIASLCRAVGDEGEDIRDEEERRQ